MTGLPKLPGFDFSDPTLTKFHVVHKFEYCNGYQVPRINMRGTGAVQLDVHELDFFKHKDEMRYDPCLTYGRTQGPAIPTYKPHFLLYESKCLTFMAFFKQSVYDSQDEHYRIRMVNIIYFMEDDTITVMEPIVRNSGFKQGRLVKRDRKQKSVSGEYWHWKDLNVGIDIVINGIVYHTIDCDLFTREYMASQGLTMNPTEDRPPDPYTQLREFKNRPTERITKPFNDKLRRYLEYDGKILQFDVVWDNRNTEYGELKKYSILYYLADDTISVKQIHTENDGYDPCSLFLRKQKIPKNWKDTPVTYASVCLELSDAEVTEYYQPKDFIIGETIFILGRRFLLYNCDEFSRTYYQKVLNITQGPPLDVFEKPKKAFKKCMPPHGELGLGSLEDSIQYCFRTIPRRPIRDEVCMILNANKCLRYTMDLDWVHPEDSIRKFLLLYSLSTGTCQIYEPPIRNSGILGRNFLRNSLIVKPGSHPLNPEYYTAADFYIGGVIIVHGHRFIVTGADLRVYRYMQTNPEKFSKEIMDNMRNYMFNQGFLDDDLLDEVKAEQYTRRTHEIEQIGKELEIIKTEREQCQDRIEENKGKIGTVNIVIDKKDPTYENVVCERGIKVPAPVCPLPIYFGDQKEVTVGNTDDSDENILHYPETEEELRKKYYADVFARHDEACKKAHEYKKTHECLPGTISANYDPQLSKKILITKQARPQAYKDSPCAKKSVKFLEHPDKCKHVEDDICCLNVPKTKCDCVNYIKPE